MRDRLIALLEQIATQTDDDACRGCEGDCVRCAYENVADYLLANGVIVLPCKVRDTVFMIQDGKIYDGTVRFLRWESHKDRGVRSDMLANPTPYFAIGASFDDFGKTVFLTKEEAEQALKEREK